MINQTTPHRDNNADAGTRAGRSTHSSKPITQKGNVRNLGRGSDVPKENKMRDIVEMVLEAVTLLIMATLFIALVAGFQA